MPANDNAESLLSSLLETEKAATCGEESKQNYRSMHQARFVDILRLCRSHVPESSARVLDIGRSELTAYLLNFYRDIHTLGFDPSVDDGGHREVTSMDTVPHITYDLLKSNAVSEWPERGPFDLIVFSEVLEHLCLAPEYVFAAIGSLLAANGVLICTTPNAADIAKRIRMAFGRNPYERLRLYSVNPGHIREYTPPEISEIAESVGLHCVSHSYFNWLQNSGGNPLKTTVMKLLRSYPPFRMFQVCVLKRKITGQV